MTNRNDSYAELVAAGTVRLERELPGPIERLWSYLTDAERRGTWLAGGAMDLRVGGRVELVFDHASLSAEHEVPEKYCNDVGPFEGTITACEEPHLLSYTWGESSGAFSEVSFELSRRGDRVLLVITHRRLTDRAVIAGVAAGWHTHVGILIDHLEGREPRPFWTTHGRLEVEYDARLS